MNKPSLHPIENDPRWAAIVARDPSADQDFVYAVKTTGIYCRPSSPTRLPKPQNVEFFATEQAAQAAGYRPSRRNAASQSALSKQQAVLVERACRQIEAAPQLPALKELADAAGLSPFHFHRVFKAHTGLTPKDYALAQRANKMRKELSGATSVTHAIYDAGYNSNSRFYAASRQVLGMQPTAYRRGGAQVQIRFAIGQCSLGAILVAQSARGICAILLGDDADLLAHNLQDQFPKATLIGGDPQFETLVAQVVGFIEAPALGLNLPLDIRGTAFQERVWRALRDIPPGATASYAEIAQAIGAPKAVRAVAQACGANRLAVAIPCHRVVRSDGAISGYRWGVERKQALLEREELP